VRSGPAEQLECTVRVGYGWAKPTRALSFAPVAPGTMLTSRLDDPSSPGASIRPSIWHASETQDVASDATLDGHADAATGIVVQLV
jgi:hypothetical protein